MEGINNIGSEQLLDSILSEHLRCFCGVVAVGTLHGHVYLLGLYSFYLILGYLVEFLGIGNVKVCEVYFSSRPQNRKLRKY